MLQGFRCHRGSFLLSPGNCKVLGGEVTRLQEISLKRNKPIPSDQIQDARSNSNQVPMNTNQTQDRAAVSNRPAAAVVQLIRPSSNTIYGGSVPIVANGRSTAAAGPPNGLAPLTTAPSKNNDADIVDLVDSPEILYEVDDGFKPVQDPAEYMDLEELNDMIINERVSPQYEIIARSKATVMSTDFISSKPVQSSSDQDCDQPRVDETIIAVKDDFNLFDPKMVQHQMETASILMSVLLAKSCGPKPVMGVIDIRCTGIRKLGVSKDSKYTVMILAIDNDNPTATGTEVVLSDPVCAEFLGLSAKEYNAAREGKSKTEKKEIMTKFALLFEKFMGRYVAELVASNPNSDVISLTGDGQTSQGSSNSNPTLVVLRKA
jgi:hypothetical protein